MQLWLAMVDEQPIAAVVSDVADFPRSRVLRALVAGGEDTASWAAPMAAALSSWALDINCASVTLGAWAASLDGGQLAPATYWFNLRASGLPSRAGVH